MQRAKGAVLAVLNEAKKHPFFHFTQAKEHRSKTKTSENTPNQKT